MSEQAKQKVKECPVCGAETLRKVTCGHSCQTIYQDYRRAVSRNVRAVLHEMRREGLATHV